MGASSLLRTPGSCTSFIFSATTSPHLRPGTQPETADRHDGAPVAHSRSIHDRPLRATALQRQHAERCEEGRSPPKPEGLGQMVDMGSLHWRWHHGVTTWVYTSYATSSFLQHSLLGAVGTVSAIVIAVGKPVSAKISDVIGRAEAWIIAVALYAIGYVVLASSNSIETYAAGWIIRSAGYAAVQILMQIIIGDVTTLRWRTLSSSLVSAPYFVNGFVGSKIAALVYEESGWRWGYGMFAILFPACAIPIVATLAWSQWKAYKLGLVHTSNPFEETQLKEQVAKRPILARIMAVCIEMDAIGLLLFTAGWTLLLLPLTIANKGSLPWSSGKIIAMLTLGPIFLILF